VWPVLVATFAGNATGCDARNHTLNVEDETVRKAEYIWIDGEQPTQQLRSKTRIVSVEDRLSLDPNAYPSWGYDGSSTYQASGGDSDLILKPVRVVRDPIRKGGSVLVLCEVFSPNGEPHETNTRARLRRVLENGASDLDPWVGFEQEYTLFEGDTPLGFARGASRRPQGPYYCGIGADRIFGRDLIEAHTDACLDAGLMLYGINAEVMPGQWEFLNVSDHLMLARWLLRRLGEQFGIEPRFDPKPAKGDWNGAGNHTNFSTREMRDPRTGMAAIRDAIDRLSENHERHIQNYGHGLADRLTGHHETCAIHEFRSGVADRGASIRVPRSVAIEGCGYLEDRRPGANCDPYLVCEQLLTTICALDEVSV
jgi:glutamine synthetase